MASRDNKSKKQLFIKHLKTNSNIINTEAVCKLCKSCLLFYNIYMGDILIVKRSVIENRLMAIDHCHSTATIDSSNVHRLAR
jgi:hypothetical protein